VSRALLLDRRGALQQAGEPATYDELFLDLGGAGTTFYMPMQGDSGTVATEIAHGEDGIYSASGITHQASGGPVDQPYVQMAAAGICTLLDAGLTLPTTAYTIVMWVRRTSTSGSGYATLVNRNGSGVGRTIYTLIDPGNSLYHWDGWDSTLDVPLNQWKMVSMRFDQAVAGGTERFGVDTSYAQRTGLGGWIAWQNDRFTFGDTTDLLHPYIGDVCRVGMIDRSLSDAEMDALHAMGLVA
jgi:hypothetical protein